MAYASAGMGGNTPTRAGQIAAAFAEKLRRLDTTQASINALSNYMLHTATSSGAGGRAAVAAAVQAMCSEWLKGFKNSLPDAMLALLYLANDLLQLAKRQTRSEAATLFPGAFASVMPRALAILGTRGLMHVPKARRVLQVWREREVFSGEQVEGFEGALEDPDSVLTGDGTEEDDTLLLLGDSLTSAPIPVEPTALEKPTTVQSSTYAPLSSNWETGFGAVTEVGPDEETGGHQQVARGRSTTSMEASHMNVRAVSPVAILERELLPAVALSIATMRKGVNSVSENDLNELVQALSDPLISRGQGAVSAVDSAEVTASLSMDDAIVAARAAKLAVVVEEESETAGEMELDLLNSTIPFDPTQQADIMQKHMANIKAEVNAREALIGVLSTLLEQQANSIAGASTQTAFGKTLTDDEQIEESKKLLSNLRSVRKRVEQHSASLSNAKRARTDEPSNGLEPGQLDDEDDTKFFSHQMRTGGTSETVMEAKALLSAVLASAGMNFQKAAPKQAVPSDIPPADRRYEGRRDYNRPSTYSAPRPLPQRYEPPMAAGYDRPSHAPPGYDRPSHAPPGYDRPSQAPSGYDRYSAAPPPQQRYPPQYDAGYDRAPSGPPQQRYDAGPQFARGPPPRGYGPTASYAPMERGGQGDPSLPDRRGPPLHHGMEAGRPGYARDPYERHPAPPRGWVPPPGARPPPPGGRGREMAIPAWATRQ